MSETPIVLEVDFDSMTLGEIDEIEDRTGLAFAEITKAFNSGDRPIGKLLRALALIQLRKSNPAATWEDTADVRLQAGQVGAPLDPPQPPSAISG